MFAKEDADASNEKEVKESFFIRVLKQLRRENNEKKQEERNCRRRCWGSDEENQSYIDNKLEQAKNDLTEVQHTGAYPGDWLYVADVILLTKIQQALTTTETQQPIEDMVAQTIEETKQALFKADNTNLETNIEPGISEKAIALETVPIKKRQRKIRKKAWQ